MVPPLSGSVGFLHWVPAPLEVQSKEAWQDEPVTIGLLVFEPVEGKRRWERGVKIHIALRLNEHNNIEASGGASTAPMCCSLLNVLLHWTACFHSPMYRSGRPWHVALPRVAPWELVLAVARAFGGRAVRRSSSRGRTSSPTRAWS